MSDFKSCQCANHPCLQCPPHFRSLHVLCPTQAHPSQQHSIYLQGQILPQPLWAARATAARASMVLLADSEITVPGFPASPRRCGATGARLDRLLCVPARDQQRCHSAITTCWNSLETTPSFKWNCPSVQAQSQVSGYPYLKDITAMVLATIKLSNHFLIHLQYNWPGDPSAAPNTTGKKLQEALKKPSTQ